MRGLFNGSAKFLGSGKKKKKDAPGRSSPPHDSVDASPSFQTHRYKNALGKRVQGNTNQAIEFREYNDVLKGIAVAEEIMGTSKIQKAMHAMQAQSALVPNISELSASVLSFSFGENAWNRRIEVPEMDFSSYSLHQDIVQLHDRMFTHQEAEFLRRSLFVLLEAKDQRLRAFCGLLGRSYHECSARRRMALTTIILASYDVLQHSSGVNSTLETDNEENQLKAKKARVFDHCASYIEDLKEAAFRSVFLEPCELYFDLVGDSTASGDVDVHGSNTFAALLEATTYIRLPRFALLDDGFAGITDVSVVQSDSFQHAVQVLRQPENIGKRYRSVLTNELSNRQIKLNRATIYCGHRTFIFNSDRYAMHATCVADLVRAATTPYLSSKENRERFAAFYLAAFAKYFSAEQIFPLLFNSCIQATSGVSDDLQTVFLALKEDATFVSIIPQDAEHYREWLWDIESFPPVFRVDAARILFSQCGVVTPAEPTVAAGEEENATMADQDDNDDDITGEVLAHGVHFDYEPSTNPLVDHLGPRVSPEYVQLSAAGDVRGGGTGREFLENLHGTGYRQGDKWLDPVGRYGRQTSWVIATATQPFHLTGYAMCSANDVPDRDPVHWRLYVKIRWDLMGMDESSPDENDWVQLHEVNLEEGSTIGDSFDPADPSLVSPIWPRWQWIAYRLPSLAKEWGVKEIPVSAVKLDILRLRGSPRIQEAQLAHWHLFGQVLNSTT